MSALVHESYFTDGLKEAEKTRKTLRKQFVKARANGGEYFDRLFAEAVENFREDFEEDFPGWKGADQQVEP